MTATTTATQFLESGHVARQLGISIPYLHELERRLERPVPRTSGGRRLFTAEDVRALAEVRKEGRRPEAAAV